jgi:pyruvate formate lyase activating enzyme
MTQAEQLHQYSAPGALWEKASDGRVRCLACAHKCVIATGRSGICGVRFNEAGALKVPWGYVSGRGLDPVEKKPFFHALPGALTFSFGMLGCNFKCSFCQNYGISQALRDRSCASADITPARPEELAAEARDSGAKLIVSTYNEPLITAEWSAAVFKEARKHGLKGAFVSNGYASSEALDYLRPYADLYKADLKTFDPENYETVIGGKLEKVLKGIEMAHEKGFWLEIVTLLIPGFNDSLPELEALAGFISGVSPDIPWHVTAFHPDYEMTDRRATPAETLLQAREAGLRKGLKFVYTGNIPGQGFEDTRCPSCGVTLIRRRGFQVLENTIRVSADGKGFCRTCSAHVPGFWK